MSLTFSILRPDDLVVLTVELRNFRLDKSKPHDPRLVIDKPKDPAFLVVHFQPQSITEKAYFEASPIASPPFNPPPVPPLAGSSDPFDPPGSVPARMSGPSRLVFSIPKG